MNIHLFWLSNSKLLIYIEAYNLFLKLITFIICILTTGAIYGKGFIT